MLPEYLGNGVKQPVAWKAMTIGEFKYLIQYIELTLYKSVSSMDFGIARSVWGADMVGGGRQTGACQSHRLLITTGSALCRQYFWVGIGQQLENVIVLKIDGKVLHDVELGY